jgi:hypothetical protein
LKQEDCEFKTSLDFAAIPSQTNKNLPDAVKAVLRRKFSTASADIKREEC